VLVNDANEALALVIGKCLTLVRELHLID